MQLTLHILLKTPPIGITYALQKGSGSKFDVIQVQRAAGDDLQFSLPVEVKGTRQANESPDFKGPFVQGPAYGRFIYIGIGTYAGDNGFGGGRIKVPLSGITWGMVDKAASQTRPALDTAIPGTGKNGGPAYATVKPFNGWKLK